ncbi:LexA repressor [Escherichia coli]|nr:LexA repressor [Escherichia coli]CAJ1306879.1 LexA repressor [Escherichia coli]
MHSWHAGGVEETSVLWCFFNLLGILIPIDELDLNEYCIHRRHSTYFVRAIGNSMTDIGLYSGDLMVVDKAEQPRHGDIVIAEIEGEFTVKRLLLTPRPALQAMNPDFPSLYPDPETLQIFGVVTAFIHKTRRAD